MEGVKVLNRNITILVIVLVIILIAGYLLWLRGKFPTSQTQLNSASLQQTVDPTPTILPPTPTATAEASLSATPKLSPGKVSPTPTVSGRVVR